MSSRLFSRSLNKASKSRSSAQETLDPPRAEAEPSHRRLTLERDLYRELLRLSAAHDPIPFLEEALRCVVAAAGSQQGYLAIFQEGRLEEPPRFWIAKDCSAEDIAQVQNRLSHGIIRESLDRGETISTASALDDPRFRAQESVMARSIRAVLCAPIGQVGVIYLEGRKEAGPFLEEDRQLLEDFAQTVLPFAERLAEELPLDDPTAPFRARLKGLEALAGRSRAMAELFQQVSLVAPLDVAVLLLGPSGAGKTAFARAIHANSRRAKGPFIELNCATLPEHLLESELFGAEKGAHSTADRRIPGKVEAARGGTLFLDEIGELSASSQAKLLQFLQSKQYFALGGTSSLTADVRLVAATNVDLEAAVAARTFREDLYYRLAVLPIQIPGLDQRIEDIVPTAEALAAECQQRHGLPPMTLSAAARCALETAEWPGNVRQLANTIEAGIIRAHGSRSSTLEVHHIFPGQEAAEAPQTFQSATRAFQKRLLAETLSATHWNVSETSRRLELARSHLNELIRAYGLRRPSQR